MIRPTLMLAEEIQIECPRVVSNTIQAHSTCEHLIAKGHHGYEIIHPVGA